MTRTPLLALALLAAPLALSPAIAASATAKPVTTIAASYVAKAGAGDLFEVRSSQLALTRSKRVEVRRFAQMMIDAHGKATADIAAAARSAGLNPPAARLEPAQTRMIARLRGTSGAAFDAVYLAQQKKAHQMALTLHQGYADKGDKAPLRTVAASAVPVVRSHIAALGQVHGGGAMR
jgi:putative membrane protein